MPQWRYGLNAESLTDCSMRLNALTGVCVHARRYLPYVGMVTIVMNDHPWVKYLLIGVLGLFVITGKD